MTELRKQAQEAWREAVKAVMGPLGFRSKGLQWRAVDELERVVLLEAGPWNGQESATFSVRAHVGHPRLSPVAVRGRIWSVYCYPAHLLDEDHALRLPDDSDRLVHQMSRHLQAAADQFLFRWDSPSEILDHYLADTATSLAEGERVRPLSQVITPGSGGIGALQHAVVWATAEERPDLAQEARRRLDERPERWYGKRERQESEKAIEEGLARLHQR